VPVADGRVRENPYVIKQSRGERVAAYLIGNYDITNEDAYRPYVAAVRPMILAYGGEILVAGPGSKIVEGKPGAVTVVLKFPSMESLHNWYDSAEYQEIISLRTDNTEGGVVFADEFAMADS
jgi:uncharacterized protein (DUF1330 family)